MKKTTLLRIALVLGVAALVLGLFYLAFVKAMPDLWPVLKSGSEPEIEAYLASADSAVGLICTAMLQFLQVVSIILPGAPIQIAAGIVYGVWKGAAICYMAYVSANLAVFTAARHLGNLLDRFAPSGGGGIFQKVKFLSDAEMPVYMTAMACIIPVVPNGIIPYAAARTPMNFWQFAAAACGGSAVPIFVMCLIGGRILAGEYLLAVLVFGVSLGLVVVLTRFRGPLMAAVRRGKEYWKQKLSR